MPLHLDYYYGNEAEQYSFYRIPKVLLTDHRYRGVSIEAKVLYGLMLDRMGLSVRNGWLDSDGRVYIYFTQEDAMALMDCGKDKATKLFRELDTGGIGLIERRKQGQGKPTRIYVKNFTLPPEPGKTPPEPEPVPPTCPPQTAENQQSRPLDSAALLTAENPQSAPLENRSLDSGFSAPNKTDKKKLKRAILTHPSLPLPPRRPSLPSVDGGVVGKGWMRWIGWSSSESSSKRISTLTFCSRSIPTKRTPWRAMWN